MEVLTKEVIASFKDAARKLTGPKRRAFEAQVTLDYLDGNIWKAEKVFGWSHHTVALGLNELRTGITAWTISPLGEIARRKRNSPSWRPTSGPWRNRKARRTRSFSRPFCTRE